MILVGAVGVAVLAAWWWRKDLLTAVNPADPNNIVNRQVNATVRNITGSDDTLGTLAYDYRWTAPIMWPSIAYEQWKYGTTEESRKLASWWEGLWQ